ncbi:MAG: hypothetical protein HQ534_08465 [Armatimonadetes bacterium]|nr:hypothetical protein [Armatimonadota bacterium]
MHQKFKFKIIRSKSYLVVGFLIFSIMNLNSQNKIYEKYSQPVAFSADLFRLVSYEDERSLHFGLSKSNYIMNYVGLELDYYNNKNDNELHPYNQILDINFCYKAELPIFNRKQFYATGGFFLRNTYLVGLPGKNRADGPPIIYSYKEKVIYKMGIGNTIGFGLNIHKNIYFENNIKFGVYFIGENDQLYGPQFSGFSDQDALFFFAIDILKFGCKFGSIPTKVNILDMEDFSFGVSLNSFRLLHSILYPNSDYGISYSFSLSLYSHKQNLELELPVYFKNYEKALLDIEENDIEPGVRKVSHFGISLKKYFYGFDFGTYLSSFIRYCYIEGDLEDDNPYTNDFVEHNENKIAIGLGAGYKYFLNENWYLDFYLQAGKYLIGNSDIFPSNNFDDYSDYSYILEIGSLKIGYKFRL